MSQKKKTTDHLYFTSRDAIDKISFDYDPESDDLVPLFPVTDSYAERSYHRLKGNKVISRIPQTESRLRFSPEQNLWSQFDYLCAVDTNTREIGEHRLSISGVVQATKRFCVSSNGQVRTAWAHSCPEIYEFTDAPVLLCEKIGWVLAIERMQRAGISERYARVGLIVDSSLSEHKEINERKRPILGKALPAGFTLIYASSDTGKEAVLNKMIGGADSLSASVFRKVTQNWALPKNAYTHKRGLYKTLRFLVPKNALPFERV